jgi:hypothetical protein
MMWTTLVPKVGFYKSFWHKQLQCKSYQRNSSAAGANDTNLIQHIQVTAKIMKAAGIEPV